MGVLVLLVLVLLVLVTGVKQSQLLDSSLGLGLEFDNIYGCQHGISWYSCGWSCGYPKPDLQIVQSVSWNLSHLPKSFCKNAWKMTQKDLSFVKNDQKRCQFREKWPKNVYFFEKWHKNVSFSWKMTQTFCEPKMFLGTSLLSFTTICRSDDVTLQTYGIRSYVLMMFLQRSAI